MNDPNRLLKWILVIGLVVASLVVLYPPDRKLKGGIDLVGGTSLLFEIDTTGLTQSELTGLSARVMRILRERVDPNGQLNLEWRPVGATRLEVRMPRPPKVALQRRETYDQAIDKLSALNITRFEIDTALNAPESERQAELDKLKRGVAERTALIEALSSAASARTAAQASGDAAAISAANTAYEKAIADLRATCLPVDRLTDLLAIPASKKRDAELEGLKKEFPSYEGPERLISAAAKAHDAWAANKGSLEDASDLKRRLRGAGVLEFRILADRDPSSPTMTRDPNSSLRQQISRYTEQLQKFGPRPRPSDSFRWFPVADIVGFMNVKDAKELDAVKSLPGRPIVEEYAGRWYVLAHDGPEYSMLKASGKKRWALVAAFPDRNPLTGQNIVSFQLDARGGEQFRKLTGSHVDRQLSIMLDDSAMSHANIREEIGERCQISGNFTIEEVQDYVSTLDAGSLPARVKDTPLAEKTIGPSLGETNRSQGISAAKWAVVLVALFALVYYGFAGGGMADIALALNLLFTLAIMALMQATFTLPGIAGLILSLGMAIDANVLIFERIREERARGVIFKKALNAGYEKAFSAIFDGNLTTLITCVILGFVGSEEVKGFAITLGIGIATSMFTALTVTRLVFNHLASIGLLEDFRMMRLIGIPKVDWVSLRSKFWPISLTVCAIGLGMFLWMSVARTSKLYDIEFLGGTSVQIDLKPGKAMTDEEVRDAVTAVGSGKKSAAQWLVDAAEELPKARVEYGEVAGQFALSSNVLNGEQLAALVRKRLEGKIDRDGVSYTDRSATFEAKAGQLTLESFRQAVVESAEEARKASAQLASARVQSVGEVDKATKTARAFEISTTETSRSVVQAAVVAALSDRLSIQRAIRFTAQRDESLTKDSFFVVESNDHYLSDVIGGSTSFEVPKFKGGVAIHLTLDPGTEPLSVDEFKRRLREVSLQPEFEQYRNRESEVIPLGASTPLADKQDGYRSFAVCALDESLVYDTDPVRWADGLAKPTLAQVEAALAREKSLSQVIQFAPQVAGQTTNRAVFAAILSMVAIGAYVWLRFGTKDFGLAVLVCLVHDVAVVLGFVAISHYVHDTFIGKLLLIDDFKVDLTMVAAVLTIIGYSLNDTIVVFDRIRENRGKSGSLSANLINTSINQTMSRTILTSLTVFVTVAILYFFGGDGIHGFAYAMLIGTISGTYSTIAIAIPLVYRPATLRTLAIILVALILIGAIFVTTQAMVARLILAALTLIVCGVAWTRLARSPSYMTGRQSVGA